MSTHEAGQAAPVDPRLDRILELMESMDARMTRLEGQVAQLSEATPPAPAPPPFSAEVATQQQAKAQLVEALTAPDTVATLTRLLARLDVVEQTLVMADQLPDLAAGAVETVEGVFAAAAETDIDLDGRLRATVALTERLTDPTTIEALLAVLEKAPELVRLTDALVASGIGDAQLAGLVSSTGLAVTQTQAARPAPVGAFGAVQSLFDRDVQRALGFFIHFAKTLGGRLAAPAG